MKKLLLIAPLLLLLGACSADDVVTKSTGTVQSMTNSDDGWNGDGEIYITYKMPGGKYGVDHYNCDTASQCSQFKVGDQITVYYDGNGIEEVSK